MLQSPDNTNDPAAYEQISNALTPQPEGMHNDEQSSQIRAQLK